MMSGMSAISFAALQRSLPASVLQTKAYREVQDYSNDENEKKKKKKKKKTRSLQKNASSNFLWPLHVFQICYQYLVLISALLHIIRILAEFIPSACQGTVKKQH